MSHPKNDIFAYFATYLPYDHIPYSVFSLGSVSLADTQKILDALATNPPADNSCIRRICAKYTDEVWAPNTPQIVTRHPSLELSLMTWSNPKRLACMTRPFRTEDDDNKCAARCAKNLAAGKCKDAFIRRAIGAVLFPEFYASGKGQR